MAITWGNTSGYLRVGIDVIQSPANISSSTTSVRWTIIYYAQTQAWEMADSQTMTLTGEVTGTVNYYMSSGNRQTVTREIARRTVTKGISYNSGASFAVGARVSGMYNGGTPSHARNVSVGPRPSSVPGAPGVPSISSVTGTAATATFSAAPTYGNPITEYQVQVSIFLNFRTEHSNWRDQTSRNFRLTGLSPGTTYFVRARALGGSWGPWSGVRSFTTLGPPAKPARPTFSNVGQTAGTANWKTPSNGGSGITGYDVQLSQNSSFSTGVSTYNASGISYRFTGLLTDVTYYVRVRARNVNGVGPYSDVGNFRTFWETYENYPTQQPSIFWAPNQDFSGRPLLIVDIAELHPRTGNTRTVTIQVSRNLNFSASNVGFEDTFDFEQQVMQYRTTEPNFSWASVGTSQTRMGVYVPLDAMPPAMLNAPFWYVRIKTGGSANLKESSWSASILHRVNHTPTVSPVYPVHGSIVQHQTQTSFRFNVVDPWGADRVSAYQVQVESTTGVSFNDTGKVALSPFASQGAITAPLSGIPYDTRLRWRVKTWDSIDRESSYSDWSIFTAVNPPELTITAPTDNQALITGAPTFLWDVGLSVGRTIRRSVVQVFSQYETTPIWSQTINGTTRSATPTQPILSNEVIYTVTITVTDSAGLASAKSHSFSTSFESPDPIIYDVRGNQINQDGYVEIDWISASLDQDQVSWRVYRMDVNQGSWDRIAEITDFSVRSFHDYHFSSGSTYMYTVTQVAERYGEYLESPVGTRYNPSTGQREAEGRIVRVIVDHYWILSEDDPTLSVGLTSVTGDSSNLEYEMEVFGLIGRGRHVDYGDRLGYTGTLTVSVRQPEMTSMLRARIEALRDLQGDYWLRTPFGKLFPIALGNIGWEPLPGTGLMEMGTLSIEYFEVG